MVLGNLEAGCRLNNELAVNDLDALEEVHSVDVSGPLSMVDQVKNAKNMARTDAVYED